MATKAKTKKAAAKRIPSRKKKGLTKRDVLKNVRNYLTGENGVRTIN